MLNQRNPRIRLSPELVRRLVQIGVPSDPASMGRAVNDLAAMSIDLRTAYIPDLADAVAMEKALADRIEEMNRVNLELLRLLVEIGAEAERMSLLGPLKDVLDQRYDV